MNIKIVVYKWFFSFEKEEAWLEKMSRGGWRLQKVNALGGYSFEKGAPQERTYKIDYRKFGSAQDLDDYVALFADSGWTCIQPRVSNHVFYFYTARDGARRDIFSDSVSRAQRYLRYAHYMGYSLIPAFVPLFVVLLNGNIRANAGYQTPGLWHMTGSEFIFHFLFETPFVILRSSVYFLPLIPFALGLFCYLRYYQMCRKTLTGG